MQYKQILSSRIFRKAYFNPLQTKPHKAIQPKRSVATELAQCFAACHQKLSHLLAIGVRNTHYLANLDIG
jgi:hypothetical protein